MQSAPLGERTGQSARPARLSGARIASSGAARPHLDAGRGFGQLPLHRHAPLSRTPRLARRGKRDACFAAPPIASGPRDLTGALDEEYPRSQPLLALPLHRQSVGALIGRIAPSSHGLRSRNRLVAAMPLSPRSNGPRTSSRGRRGFGQESAKAIVLERADGAELVERGIGVLEPQPLHRVGPSCSTPHVQPAKAANRTYPRA
jgi:hypothetical protein